MALGDFITGLGAALAGYGTGRQQRTAQDVALGQLANQTQQTGADVGLAQAQTAATTQATEQNKSEYERKIKGERTAVLQGQLKEIENGIVGGMLDPNDPRTNQALQTTWQQYAASVEDMFPGYKMPASPYDVKRTLTPQEVQAISSAVQRVDTSNPQEAGKLADAFRVDPSVIQQLGAQGQKLTPGEEAQTKLGYAEIASRQEQAEKELTANTILAASKHPGFLALDESGQRNYLNGLLSGVIDPAKAEKIASSLPQIKDVLSADVAKQVAAQVYATGVEAKVKREQMRSEEKINSARNAVDMGVAKLRSSTDVALGKLQAATSVKTAEIAAGSRENVANIRADAVGSTNPYGGSGKVNPMSARKNLVDARKLLDNPQTVVNMSEDQKHQVYAMMGDNLSVISFTVGSGQGIDPQTLTALVASDPTPTKTKESWSRWMQIEQGMHNAKWPQEYIDWFYKERYEPIFGPKANAPKPATKRK